MSPVRRLRLPQSVLEKPGSPAEVLGKRFRETALESIGASMTDNEQCILQNQIEIMGALSLLLRYVKPELIGKAGELDNQRDDLLVRHKITMKLLVNQ